MTGRTESEHLDQLIEEMEGLLAVAPAWLSTPAGRLEFLRVYAKVLLEHRDSVRLLVRGPPVDGGPATDRARAVHRRLTERLAGPRADLETRVRACMALSGLCGAVTATRDGDVATVLRVSVQSSLAALGGTAAAAGQARRSPAP
ncbi:MAG TPA: hypothetical protein VEL73_04890 [Mycobacteriales bacterium]|nr:hypothetical protein [Mycobacteriales bacterium]